MTEPRVDVIIPVHTEIRPIARAVASVLDGCRAKVRVTVVCHNTPLAGIVVALGRWAHDARVRLLEHHDGIPSPAGPINAGYAAATAEFTTLLDSDDEYETGAIDAWLAVQQRDDADVVIAPLRRPDGKSSATPPARPGRIRSLDGVKDRLAYRTRQHGLVRRSAFPELEMTPGLRTGEDVIQGLTLWFSRTRISLAPGAPAYVIHTDVTDRASTSMKTASESLLFLEAVLAPEFLSHLMPAQVEALAIKLLRTHIMDVLAASLRVGSPPDDLAALSTAVQRVLEVAPTATGIMSRREARIISGLQSGAEPHALAAELEVLTDYRRPANLMPASARRLLHREAMPRFLAAVALTR